MSIDTTACTPEEWDAAKRVADAVNLHVLAHKAQLGNGRDTPGYVAVRLADGRSPDGVLYDTRRDAARHWPPYPEGMMYVKIGRDDMSVKEGLIILMMHRQAFAKGVVFSEEEIVVPHRLELASPFIPRTLRGANWHG
jgi:hypothetical protein